LLVVKHTVVSVSALRIANLVLAPVASAFLSEAIANHRAKENPFIIPRNHFWQALFFTLGLVLVRFAYASRA
jgi:ABC-type Fe3+ transport system permease subunit